MTVVFTQVDLKFLTFSNYLLMLYKLACDKTLPDGYFSESVSFLSFICNAARYRPCVFE